MAVNDPEPELDEEDVEQFFALLLERGRGVSAYAESLPDVWLPGELEEHRRRIEQESGYIDQPRYIRPEEFGDMENDFPEFPELPEFDGL